MADARLSIDEAWAERLREVRRGQAVAPEVEALLGVEAVFLYGWLGNSAHLGLDGRVAAWAAADGQPPAVVADAGEFARLIVLGARWLGILELVDLLPAVPPGGQACPYCAGRRWIDTMQGGHSEGSLCIVCKGVGWQAPRQTGPLPSLPD